MPAGTTGGVGTGVGTSATARTPTRIPVRLARVPGPQAGMGSTGPNGVAAALGTSVGLGTASLAAAAGAVEAVAIEGRVRVEHASAAGLGRMATARRPFGTALGRLGGMRLGAAPPCIEGGTAV